LFIIHIGENTVGKCLFECRKLSLDLFQSRRTGIVLVFERRCPASKKL